MNGLKIFILSIATYSFLRIPDVYSTKKLSSILDLKLHEINPLVVFLNEKIGFNQTMVITWIIFAPIVGLFDYLTSTVFNFPIFAAIFGSTHLLAAANNLQIYFKIQIEGPETVQQYTYEMIAKLRKLPRREKIIFLLKNNFYDIFLGLYCFFIIISIYLSDLLQNILFHGLQISQLLINLSLAMAISLLMFFPTVALGLIIISIRRIKFKGIFIEQKRIYVKIPVKVVELALKKAKKVNAEFISIPIQVKNYK